MALFKSLGIVFRSSKYSESSLILDIYTRDKGLRSFIVSGLRSSKSRGSKASLYQHLNILDLVAYDKEDKLARIKECRLDYHYQRLTFDVMRSSVALFILEFCKNTIKEHEENHELFDFIQSRFKMLDNQKAPYLPLFGIKFILDLSRYIGFMPYNNYDEDFPFFDLYNGKYISQMEGKYIATADVSKAIAEIDGTTIDELYTLTYDKLLRNRIIDDLIIYYRLHIENFRDLKTLEVLRSIF